MVRKLIIVAFLILSGCRPVVLFYTPAPDGPPEYRLGWEDGCDTGVSAEDQGYLLRAVYGYKKRPELADNDSYKKGWDEGFQYCRFTQAAQH